jgi:hypothetical protein
MLPQALRIAVLAVALCGFRVQAEARHVQIPQDGQVSDRILATVGGTLVLQSDAVALMRLGVLQPPAGRDPLQWAMDRLIERRLMLIEVDRYGPPEPDRAEIDR